MNERRRPWSGNDTDDERRRQIEYGRRETRREQGREEDAINGNGRREGAGSPVRIDPATERLAGEAARRADKDIGTWIADAVRETAASERNKPAKASRGPYRGRGRARRAGAGPQEGRT